MYTNIFKIEKSELLYQLGDINVNWLCSLICLVKMELYLFTILINYVSLLML